MDRMARCSCGNLRVEVSGDPTFVAACHCGECQRRTGSVFGVSAYFPKTQVHRADAGKIYVRDGHEGRKLRNHFCPDCGTTVYWEAERFPDHLGIAVGAFLDPQFPPPTRSVWEESRHKWVAFEHEVNHLAQQAGPAPTPKP